MQPRVELFYAPVRDVADRELYARLLGLLTPEERKRHDAFVFEKNRREFLVTRALARGILGALLGLPPKALRFVAGTFGKPALAPDLGVRFNLSNTIDLVVCAVSREYELGVDTEPLARADNVLGLADRVFTPVEVSQLASLDAEGQRHRAIENWVLKEAYMKACGLGMSLPLVDFGFDGRTLVLAPSVADDAARWRFEIVQLEEHLVAVAVGSGADTPVELDVRAFDLRAIPTTG